MFCIFALGVRKDLFRGAGIDKKTFFHHADVVAYVLDDGEVVRDEKNRKPEVAAKVPEKVQDSRLDRHVERRDRLVGDQDLRLAGERTRDRDALALAAGKLARILVEDGL